MADRPRQVLISRCFKNDTWDVSNLTEAFRLHVLQAKEGGAAPVRVMNDTHFMYIRHADVYVVLVAKTNSNVALGFKVRGRVWGGVGAGRRPLSRVQRAPSGLAGF